MGVLLHFHIHNIIAGFSTSIQEEYVCRSTNAGKYYKKGTVSAVANRLCIPVI